LEVKGIPSFWPLLGKGRCLDSWPPALIPGLLPPWPRVGPSLSDSDGKLVLQGNKKLTRKWEEKKQQTNHDTEVWKEGKQLH